jgi:hypothetical protein
MDKSGTAELRPLVKAGTANIERANRAASAVLSVVGELNTAQATFLRSSSIRHQVEQRLAASYAAQVEPLELACGDLERELATLEPQHRRIVELLQSEPAHGRVSEAYLRGIIKLSAASVLATAELAAFPEALEWLGKRLSSLEPVTDRLAPAMRRVLVALQPAVTWGDRASAILGATSRSPGTPGDGTSTAPRGDRVTGA